MILRGKALQESIIKHAQTLGWRVAHFYPMQTKDGYWRTPAAADGKGFPDLILVRDRVIAAEVKGDGDKISPQQETWLRAFAEAGVDTFVWTPKEWFDGDVHQVLQHYERREVVPFDPRPRQRVHDADLLKRLHLQWRECAVCGTSRGRLSLHHIHKHPRDDVEENLVMLCGDGVTGCHGQIELANHATKRSLGEYLLAERPDTLSYLTDKLGGEEQARAWLETYLLAA